MLSSRLDTALNVTLRSMCTFDSPIELLFISSHPARVPARYGACRILPMIEREAVDALNARGFHPLSMCALNTSSALLSRGVAGGGGGGRNFKHATCLNHLRFYLAELPVLRDATSVILLDDDIVVRRSLADYLWQWLIHVNDKLVAYD